MDEAKPDLVEANNATPLHNAEQASNQNAPIQASIDVASSQPKEPSPFSKPCSLCERRRDVLIRCKIDESKKWKFICPGKCWQSVTGGFTGASEQYPHYVYGGTWKNKHAYVSGKIKGKAKEENKNQWNGTPGPHRMRGNRAKKVSKSDMGQSRIGIGADDGGSDIEVSELSDWSEEFEYEESEGKDHNLATDSTSTVDKDPEAAAAIGNWF